MSNRGLASAAVGASLHPGEIDRSVVKTIADRMIAISSEMVGENLDEKLSAALPHLYTNEVGVEPFGTDVDTCRISVAVLAYLYRWWFRVESHGLSNIPDGRVLVVSNHGGQIPIDGVMIAMAMVLDADRPRFPRALVERFIQSMPFLSMWFPRVGQVMGSPENARRLLESDESLIVFPEGVKGISKTFEQRYRLAPFGQGFIRLALQTESPIVPVAVIGAEEQYPSVANLKGLSKLVGLPAVPVIPQLFFGMLAPLPTKYRIYFGEPLYLKGDPDDDDAAIEEKVWRVRATIQSMVNRGLKERSGIFW
ncbi:MAG: lysophospholipid acyltransferase family protein [Myxococcales bacterium]|nr:lysophospholipid acyltransferase family protein [Myxococcales bacterium]MDD9968902.1 lysophospholipid acyltransferase family protein [Myxococcales bacterium]